MNLDTVEQLARWGRPRTVEAWQGSSGRPARFRVERQARAPEPYCAHVPDDQGRPHPLRGFWALIGGGLVVATMLVALDPVTSQEGCSNYHAAGNASAFDDPTWDLYMAMVGLGWVALTTLEQFLPITHRGWNGWFGAIARSMIAIGLSVIGCCCLIGQFLIMCH